LDKDKRPGLKVIRSSKSAQSDLKVYIAHKNSKRDQSYLTNKLQGPTKLSTWG